MPSDILILLRKTAVGACVPKPDHRRFKVAAKGAYAKATAGLVCDVQFLCHLTNQFRERERHPQLLCFDVYLGLFSQSLSTGSFDRQFYVVTIS